MKHLHVFAADENQKFSIPFINFINNNFEIKDHYFLLTLGKNYPQIDNTNDNVEIIPYGIRGMKRIINLFGSAEKVYLHGLSKNKYIYLALLLRQKELVKFNWIIWGTGLYFYRDRDRRLTSNIIEIVRKKVLPKFGGIISHLEGDFLLAKEWYGVNAKYYYSILYPNNLFIDTKEFKPDKNENTLYIQVGNSGGSSNYHLEVLEKLEKFKEQDIKIICPLSYSGKEDYIDEVIKKGIEIFGENKFLPLTDFMPFEEYSQILSKIDVAIFNHRRQRGLANIIVLLGLGKKVYIREDISTWNFFEDKKIKVFSMENELENIFENMNQSTVEKNISLVKHEFSEKQLKDSWIKIFEASIY
jgi:hypothetical protein